jgi:hypothetical protein
VVKAKDYCAYRNDLGKAIRLRDGLTDSPSRRWRPLSVMDEPTKAELHKTETELALGERHISSQRAPVARLEQNGSDAALARQLLKTFLQIQQLHQDRHNQLRRELASDTQ